VEIATSTHFNVIYYQKWYREHFCMQNRIALAVRRWTIYSVGFGRRIF